MVAKSLMAVMHLYGSHGFLVQMVHADSEFKVLCGPLAGAGSSLNVCASDEHLLKVECFIHTIKEQTWCMYHLIPFTCFPAQMLKELIMASVFYLNMFPPHDGVSDTLSPQALMRVQSGLQ